MDTLTITEALAELKTLGKRISKKRQFILDYLWRQEQLKDPLAAEGGSLEALRAAEQGVKDLEERQLALRRAIAETNQQTEVTVMGVTRSIADWLVWRREIAPMRDAFYGKIRQGITGLRQEAQRKGFATVAAEAEAKPGDIIVNLSEKRLAEESEELQEILGTLDGALSLKNATTTITI